MQVVFHSSDLTDYRASFVSRGQGLCFVAHPGDLDSGAEISVKLQVAGQPAVELTGCVQRTDFDEQGNAGVLVELSADSVALVSQLNARLDAANQVAAPAPVTEPAKVVRSSVSGLVPARSQTSRSGRRLPAITAPPVGVVSMLGAPPPPQLPQRFRHRRDRRAPPTRVDPAELARAWEAAGDGPKAVQTQGRADAEALVSTG